MALDVDDVDFMDEEEDWGPPDAEPVPGKVRIIIEADGSETYLLETVARLLLGGATEGGELLARRLKLWQAQTDRLGGQIYSESPDETEGERLRYALLGLAAKGPGMAEAALATAVTATDSAYRLVSNVLSPLTNSRLLRPLMRRYDGLATHGETIVERWIDAGRAAEQRSRALARQATDAGSEEGIQVMVGKMAQEPALRDLVAQQGMGMADEVIDAVRLGTARADVAWERRLRALFGRH